MTSEPDEQNLAISSSSSLTQAKTQQAQAHMPFKIGQMEVELGGSVTLQCPQGNYNLRLIYRKFNCKRKNYLKQRFIGLLVSY